eukprot:5276418-Alexandrium_andersonii.AAC.1
MGWPSEEHCGFSIECWDGPGLRGEVLSGHLGVDWAACCLQFAPGLVPHGQLGALGWDGRCCGPLVSTQQSRLQC